MIRTEAGLKKLLAWLALLIFVTIAWATSNHTSYHQNGDGSVTKTNSNGTTTVCVNNNSYCQEVYPTDGP